MGMHFGIALEQHKYHPNYILNFKLDTQTSPPPAIRARVKPIRSMSAAGVVNHHA